MTATRAMTLGAALVLLGLLPVRADAQSRGHGHAVHHHARGSRVVVFAPFLPLVAYPAPPVYYPPPTVYYQPAPAYAYAPPAYASAPPAYAAPPPAVSAPPPPPEPLQREVVYATGRYVLRGDGLSTPYTWVWIPNPPSAPPGAPSGSIELERPIYSWRDADGVSHWTDRLSTVPPEHRANARREP
jgi:hypothetical protein